MAGALAICVALSSLLAFAGASVFIYSRIIKEGLRLALARKRGKASTGGRVKSVSPKA
jgi:hypothetical protein